MQRFLLLTLSLFITAVLTGQRSVWDGGADGLGTDWGTAENWVGDALPASGDSIVFNSPITVTVSGTALPIRNLYINGGAQVSLDLDITAGDGTADSHGLQIAANSALTILDGATLTLSPGATKNGIQIGGTAEGAELTVTNTGTVNISGGKHGINCSNAGAVVMMRGTMLIDAVTNNGIRLTDGTIENRGGLTISNAGANGIENDATFSNVQTSTTVLTITDAATCGIKNKANGVFTNDKDIVITGGSASGDGINTLGSFVNVDNSANITISGATDDGIEVVSGTFANGGTVTSTAGGTTSGSNALSVTGGIFSNTSSNSLIADGGTGSGRAINIAAGATLDNTGAITISGGNANRRIDAAGDISNGTGGTIDLGDGKITTTGTLTNDGFIESTVNAPAIVNEAGSTVTNNAFYNYVGKKEFAKNATGLTDNGINLDDNTQWKIDVAGGCETTIANTAYEYETTGTDGASVGTSSADGTLTFDESTFGADDTNLKPVGIDLNGGKVQLQNATCSALPIELTSLEAVAMPKSIMVKWTVANETDNDYIAVERSTDGADFFEIGRVAGNGTSSLSADFELEDTYPDAGTNYYRLRQVDIDGTANYSQVVSADFAGAAAGAMRVFPTLVSAGGQLNVDLRESASTPLIVTDANGRRVGNYQLAGGTITPVTIGNLQPGVYYLRNAGSATTTRFIVK